MSSLSNPIVIDVYGGAKIRTYNYPQGRVTEHRINLTRYNLQSTISGDIQEYIDELQLAENAEKLKEGRKKETD